jgi:HPt (histidine-containing phosphotransfer) domain-containing protein
MTEFEGPTPKDRFYAQTLENYSDGDVDFTKELVESYQMSVNERLPQLRKAFETNDEGEAVLHSHDIKGSSSYIGAEAVRFVSGKIEALCRSKNLKDAEAYLHELEAEVKEVFVLLDKYTAGLGVEGAEGAAAEEETNEKNTDKAEKETEKDTKEKEKEKHADKETPSKK